MMARGAMEETNKISHININYFKDLTGNKKAIILAVLYKEEKSVKTFVAAV